MIAINNSNVVDAMNDCGCVAFQPVVNYAITNVGTQYLVTFTHSITYDSGDAMGKVLVHAYDKSGNERHGTVSGAGTGATLGTVVATANVITSIPVTAGGSGYTSPPTVVLTGGAGTGAVAKAVINAAGVVTAITIESGGTGYSTVPTATLIVTSAVLNVTGLNLTDGLDLQATVISNKGCKADFGTYGVKGLNAALPMSNKSEAGDNVSQ
jgi:hypothetical protein